MAYTTIHGRQLRLATVARDKIDAAFQTYLDALATTAYVDQQIAHIGNAFNYVGVQAGGASAGAANDLALLAADGKNPGDYYKVSTSGWFKVGAGAAFFANANDGLVWNTTGTVDVIDNTNSSVSGTSNFVTVTGSSDTGYVVDLDTIFKTRISDIETDLGDASTLTTTATSAITAINELDAEIGNLSTLTTTAQGTLVSAINEIQAEVTSLDPSTKFVREKATGINGVVVDFVLTKTPSPNTLCVFLNGVLQELTDDYTVNIPTKTVTMLEAPFTGDKMSFTYFEA